MTFNLFYRRLDLNEPEKRAFRLHMLYHSLEGVILGVLAMNEYVFIKSVNGSNYQLSLLFQFSVIVFVFLIFFNEMRKRIRNIRLLLRISALLTRTPLFLLLFFPHEPGAYLGNSIYHLIFLGIFLVYYFGNIIISPAIVALLKNNYRHQNFGRLYSYASSLNKTIMLVVTFIYGLLLDKNLYAFTYVFPIVSVCGVVSVFILSRIDYSRIAPVISNLGLWRSVIASIRNMFLILKSNKAFLHFEVGFMLYGFAFMIVVVVINFFFQRGLDLNYSSVAFYKNSYNILAIMILPFTGRLLGRLDPRRFTMLPFLSMLLYVFFLLMTNLFPSYTNAGNLQVYYMLIPAFLAYGMFAATMELSWNIGSAYFGTPQQADDYHSVHLFLTGLRSIFAPFFGVFIYEMMDFTGTFLVAIGFLILSMLVLAWSQRRVSL